MEIALVLTFVVSPFQSGIFAQDEHVPGGLDSVNLTRIVPDTIIHNDSGQANLDNWEPYTSVLGKEVFLIEANTFAQGSAADQRYTVTFQPVDGSAPTLGEAFFADNGEPYRGPINGSRQNGNPGRVAGDKRPGAVNLMAGGEASPHLRAEFKTDNRWNLGFNRLQDGRYGTVQISSFNQATGIQTPLSKAMDSATGRVTSGVAPQSEISRFGGDLAGLSNGNFVSVVDDRSLAVAKERAAVATIFAPDGAIVKDSFVVAPGQIWSNVAAYKDGFCVRVNATLFFFDNDGNLRGESPQDTAVDLNGASIHFDRGRGDGTRIASHINSHFVFLSGNTGIDIFVAAWDARTRTYVGHSNVNELVPEFGGTGNDTLNYTAAGVDRVSIAVDALNRLAIAFGSTPQGYERRQVLCRVLAFHESEGVFSHLTSTFLAMVNNAPTGGIEVFRPSVSMTTKEILIAAKGSVNSSNDPLAGADTPAQTTVYTVFSHPDPKDDLTPPIPGSSAPVELSISKSNGSVTVEWTGGGPLQSAAEVDGPYSNVSGAVSPHTINVDQSKKFYRVAD